jgi:predicted transcriptional regulator with HTH domain
MQQDEKLVSSFDMKRPLVVRSLNRSKIRKKIAEYLFDISPSGSYTSDIAYNVKTTPTNVIGAIRGMDSRYKQEESLLSLQIVEQIHSGRRNDIKLYRLTNFGKEIIQKIRD